LVNIGSLGALSKLVILFVVIAAAVIVLELGVIVFVVCSYCPPKGLQAIAICKDMSKLKLKS